MSLQGTTQNKSLLQCNNSSPSLRTALLLSDSTAFQLSPILSAEFQIPLDPRSIPQNSFSSLSLWMWPTPNWRENFRHDRTNTITFLIFDSLILLMESKITGVSPPLPHPGGGGADYIILLGFIEFWCLLKILKFFHRFCCQTLYIYLYTWTFWPK